MPRFRWTGLDLTGSPCKGTQSCASVELLQHLLLQQEIALISVRPEKKLWDTKWKAADSLYFFSNLYELLRAGLFLPEALAMMHENESRSHRKEIIEEIAQQISTGTSLSQALIAQRFSNLDCSLSRAGQESGQLCEAIGLLAEHYAFEQAFAQRLKKALVMPCMSICFFVIVFGFILFGLLPKVATLFAQQQVHLPWLTKILLKISNSAGELIIFCITIVAIGLSFQWLRVTKPMLAHRIMLRIPLVGYYTRQRALVSFFKTLSLLVNGNMSLVTAIELSQQSIGNLVLRADVDQVIAELSKGESLSKALSNIRWFQQSVSMIALGEQTGKLPPVIGRVASLYEQRFAKSLDAITLTVQPTLIVVMGICIAGLISAVYVPIISLAGAIKI